MSDGGGVGPHAPGSSATPVGIGSAQIVAGDGSAQEPPKKMQATPRLRKIGPIRVVYRLNRRKKMMRCGVTVLHVGNGDNGPTIYASGFVLMKHQGTAYIFTRNLDGTERHMLRARIYVQFYGSNVHKRAKMLCEGNESNNKFMVIVARELPQDNYPYPSGSPISITPPTSGRAGYEQCFTIATVSGTKLHANSETPLPHFLGRLGLYDGKVLTPDCGASSYANNAKAHGVLKNTASYFMLSCPFRDTMVTPHNIDRPAQEHTSKRILAAPVCRLNGRLLGALASSSTYVDVKYSLHFHEMVARIEMMDPMMEEGLDWQGKLRRLFETKTLAPLDEPWLPH